MFSVTPLISTNSYSLSVKILNTFYISSLNNLLAYLGLTLPTTVLQRTRAGLYDPCSWYSNAFSCPLYHAIF